MKNVQYWLTLIVLWTAHLIHGQHFEIPIFFEDSAGNRDSLVLGYDQAATYGIDPPFGEIDLIDSSFSSAFEIRAAIYDYWEWPTLPRTLESKKMMIPYICFDSSYFDEANSIMVVIKCDHWPITISWNNEIFQEGCNHIDIIDCTPGGWFDVCGGGHPYTILEMPLVDIASYYDSEFKITNESDTLGALFFRFYNDFGSSVIDPSFRKDIKLYPNPTLGSVHLDYPIHVDDKLFMTDIFGRSIPFTHFNQEIDLTKASDGLYILSVRLHAGGFIVKKILKKCS